MYNKSYKKENIIMGIFFIIWLLFLFTRIAYGQVVPVAQQFIATTTPVTAITQAIFARPIKITGLTVGQCLTLDSNSILTTTSCGSGGGSGTVTSVDMTVPLGLSISGNPITTSGTLALTLTPGFNIPLTASTTQWNNLYNASTTLFSAGTGLTLTGKVFSVNTTQNITTLSNLATAGTVNTTASGGIYSTGTSSLSVSSPLTVTGTFGALIGGTNSTINCQTASGSQAGCLASADFATFNGKQAAGNYITALTGDVTATGPGSVASTLATVNSNIGSFTNANITVNAKGLITAASNGTASGAVYPFPLSGNSTSTLTQFNGGLTAFASSTIGNSLQTGGLTISGGATTTGSLTLPSLATAAGSFIAVDQSGKIIATTTPSGGGSTSPGGSNTNIQFNNSGAFGGTNNANLDTSGNITTTGTLSLANANFTVDAAGDAIVGFTNSPNNTNPAQLVFGNYQNAGPGFPEFVFNNNGAYFMAAGPNSSGTNEDMRIGGINSATSFGGVTPWAAIGTYPITLILDGGLSVGTATLAPDGGALFTAAVGIGGINGINLPITGTSTLGSSVNGIDITNGCFSKNGVCIGGGGSSGITAIGPLGQTQTGATQTLATTTSIQNGVTHAIVITAAGNTQTFTPSDSGTLTVAGGGTGQISFTSSNVLYGSGSGAIQSIATGTIAASTGITVSGSPYSLNGGTTITNTGVISNSCPGGFLSCSGTNPSTFTLGTLGVANGGTGSTTLFGILKGNGTSQVATAIGDTDYQKPITLTTTGTSGAATFTGDTLNIPNYTTGGSGAAYPFPLLGNATSTLTQFNGGITAFASSTIGNGLAAGGLTVAGNATTTGTGYFFTALNIGTTTQGQGGLNIASSTFMNGTALSLVLTSATSPNISGGLQQEVNGQLIDYGVNYAQLPNLNSSNVQGFFRIDTRTGQEDKLFSVMYSPASSGSGSQTSIFKVSRTGETAISGGIVASTTNAISTILGRIGIANSSTTLSSVYTKAFFGSTATTTIDSTGNIVIPSGSTLTNTGKTDGCATWATGVLNSTGTACGSGGSSIKYASYVVAATGGDFTTIQGALDACGTAGGGYIYLTDATYSIGSTGLLWKGSNCSLWGRGAGTTTIAFTGATTAIKTNSAAGDYTHDEIHNIFFSGPANTTSIAINWSDMTHGVVDNVQTSAVGTSLRLNDTQNITFYNSFTNLDFNDNHAFCIDASSTNPVNANKFDNIFCGDAATSNVIGLQLNNANGNSFNLINIEPGSLTGTVGLKLFDNRLATNNGVFNNTFSNFYIEANATGVSIASTLNAGAGGIQRNTLTNITSESNTLDWSVTPAAASLNTINGYDSNFGTPINVLQGPVGVGTSSELQSISATPFAYLGVNASSTQSLNEFVVGGNLTRTDLLVNNTGYLALGGTNPTSRLTVTDQTTGDATLPTVLITGNTNFAKAGDLLKVSNNNGSDTGTTTQIINVGTGTSFEVDDQANDTSPFVIDASGNTGIGTTTPWRTLSVVGTVAINGLSTETGDNSVCINSTTKQIVNAGNTTCLGSSKYLKHDIVPITSEQAAEVLNMRPIQYAANEDNTLHYGFIAEEVAAIDPKLAEYAQEDTVMDGHLFKKGDPISVDYTRDWALLTKLVQDQQVKINNITAGAVRDVQDNWQWLAIGLLAIGFVYQQIQIRKLKK